MGLNVLGYQSHLLQRCHHPAYGLLRIFPSLSGSRLRFFVAMQVQHSCLTPCQSFFEIVLTTQVVTLSATEARLKDLILSRIELCYDFHTINSGLRGIIV